MAVKTPSRQRNVCQIEGETIRAEVKNRNKNRASEVTVKWNQTHIVTISDKARSTLKKSGRL